MVRPRRLTFDSKEKMVQEQGDYDMEIPLSWDPRYNVGSIQLYQGDTVTKTHEVRKQIRFCIQIPNARDQDLYSARLSEHRDGIILTEPIVPRHLRDASLLDRWMNISAAVKFEQKNENLAQDISVKVHEINSLVHPVKKTFFRFPDGITCTNRFFNDSDTGIPPADTFALVKWPFMLPDGDLNLLGLPQKVVTDETTKAHKRVPYDNLVPGFFWDMAQDVDKVERTAHQNQMDTNELANRLQAALEING